MNSHGKGAQIERFRKMLNRMFSLSLQYRLSRRQRRPVRSPERRTPPCENVFKFGERRRGERSSTTICSLDGNQTERLTATPSRLRNHNTSLSTRWRINRHTQTRRRVNIILRNAPRKETTQTSAPVSTQNPAPPPPSRARHV